METKIALLGDPISHSLSPKIYNNFAFQFRIKLNYSLIQTQELKPYLDLLGSEFIAFNLTSPLKKQVSYGNLVSVNMLHAVNGVVKAYNTDGIGFVRDLVSKGINLNNKNIVVLGTGGAAISICESMLAEFSYLKNLRMVSRNPSLNRNIKVPILSYKNIDLTSQTVIINATSAGLHGDSLALPRLNLTNSICYDLNYGKNSLEFLNWAKTNGCVNCYDGIGMLVEQAAEAFKIWFNKVPCTKRLKEELHGEYLN